MRDAAWKGALLSFVLCVVYCLLIVVVASNVNVPNMIGLMLVFFFWIPQLSYSLPILVLLRKKNLPKTHFGFKIVFILLMLLNIALLVVVIRAGA